MDKCTKIDADECVIILPQDKKEEEKATRIKEKAGNQHSDYERRSRDLVAYWLLGFGNNFTYWVMLTAAYDLIAQEEKLNSRSPVVKSSLINDSDSLVPNFINNNNNDTIISNQSLQHDTICLSQSTGAILVADTIPAAVVTSCVMLVRTLHTKLRVSMLLLLCLLSYLTLGLAPPEYTLPGVALASLSRGLSDTTFLAHAAYYHPDVLSLWSSGTGVATFVGPLIYSGLTTAGVSPSVTLLSFLIVPFSSAISFFCILTRPKVQETVLVDYRSVEKQQLEEEEEEEGAASSRCGGLLLFLESLQRSLPLSVFYFVMYFTNQGLVDLIYFSNSSLTHAQQYSWVNTARGLGTFISRSSHHFLLLPRRWMYNIVIVLLMLAVIFEVIWQYLATVHLLMGVLLLQGLLEGAAFRHTIYELSSEVNVKKRDYYLSVFPSALFIPATVAGIIAMPVHQFLCSNLLVLNQ